MTFVEVLLFSCVGRFTVTYKLLKSAKIQLYFSARILQPTFAGGRTLAVGCVFIVDLRTTAGGFGFNFYFEIAGISKLVYFFFSLFLDSGEDSSGTQLGRVCSFLYIAKPDFLIFEVDQIGNFKVDSTELSFKVLSEFSSSLKLAKEDILLGYKPIKSLILYLCLFVLALLLLRR